MKASLKFVEMNDYSDAVENALQYLDNKYGSVWTWPLEKQRWWEEWRIELLRAEGKTDKMVFRNEEEFMMWLLKWS